MGVKTIVHIGIIFPYSLLRTNKHKAWQEHELEESCTEFMRIRTLLKAMFGRFVLIPEDSEVVGGPLAESVGGETITVATSTFILRL